jgi:hypothetical protein
MQFLILAGVILVILLIATGGAELDQVIHAYPAQFWMGVFAVLFIAAAAGAARFRAVLRDQVPLRPAVPPLPKAIPAVPLVTAIAPPYLAEEAQDCEGPECRNKVDDDPWKARVAGSRDEHVFCSQQCVQAWQGNWRADEVPR